MVNTAHVHLVVTAACLDPCPAVDRPDGEYVVIGTALDQQFVLSGANSGIE